MPKSKLGKWTVGLIFTFFIAFSFLMLMAFSGQEGGDTIFDNLLLGIPGIIAALSGILAFVTAVISIFKYKDRSVLVILAAIIGLIIVFFLSGEFIFPH